MRSIRHRSGAIILILLFMVCGKRSADDPVIARVGDAVLRSQEMRRKMAWEGMRPEQISEYVDRWVNRELLVQEARRQNLDQDENLRWELDLVEKEFLVQKLLEQTFARSVQITDGEIEAYYEKNKEMYLVTEDEVRASHVLTETREEANLAHQEITAGMEIADVARERSVGSFRDRGGDLGFFRRGDTIAEIERVAFALREGSVSRVFQSSHGFHIIKVVKKRRQGSYKALQNVRDEILQHLRVTKERSVYRALISQLQNNTKVEVIVPPQSDTVDSVRAIAR